MKRIDTAIFTIVTMLAAAPVMAQAPVATPSPAAVAPPAPSAAAPAVTAGFDNGFFIQSSDGDNRLVFGLVAQVDGRFSVDDPPPITNTFTIRKVRPTFSGRVAKFFDFKVMPDLGNGTTVVQDAYVDIRFARAFRVRTGKDKTPIGYELLQGDAFLLFPERALASSLVPNRDTGVQVQGDVTQKLFYAAGVFNGIPDGTSSTAELDANSGKDVAGRIVVQPFRSATPTNRPLNGLGFQVGGSTGTQAGALPSFRTSVGQTYFTYASGAAAAGERHRVSPALFYYYRSFGGFAEYMRSTQTVARAGGVRDLTNRGWEVTGSYLVTGEAASDRGVRPGKPFDPPSRRWGALQLLARYSALHVDGETFAAGFAAAGSAQAARSFTLAANWYPATVIKYYATFERTRFEGGTQPARPTENVILFRAQLGF